MSEHKITLKWTKQTPDFTYDTYNREHTWGFKDGVSIKASAALDFKGKAGHVDPEETLVAAASSCHMLTFLAIAAKKGIVVEEYIDQAVGLLEKNAEGMLAVTRITLTPQIRFSGNKIPDKEALERLHESAHHHCFIANSIKAQIIIDS